MCSRNSRTSSAPSGPGNSLRRQMPTRRTSRALTGTPPPPWTTRSPSQASARAQAGGSAAPTVLGPLGRADGFAAALRKKPHTAAPKQPLPSAQRQPSARRTAEAANLTRACNSVAAPIKWVETGTAVESMYRDARSTARDHARIRNAYFQQATQAYLSGNRALAKELGAKGRAAGEAMKEAHEAASQQIYHSRNQQRARGEDGLIDLHGLHISEAISFLERELEDFRQQGRSPVYVLVGTGHHTRTHRATLPVAVENYLKERVVPFRVSQPGLLELRL
uniref:Protein ctc-interacting domain 7-like n=1 Tax=Tetraselmis sp. GSL018 TaxID=582737 RepID=A0A061R9C0_9CHLO